MIARGESAGTQVSFPAKKKYTTTIPEIQLGLPQRDPALRLLFSRRTLGGQVKYVRTMLHGTLRTPSTQPSEQLLLLVLQHARLDFRTARQRVVHSRELQRLVH